MTVVLDAPAAVALAVPGRDPDGMVEKLFESNVCYMTSAAVIEMYCAVFDSEGAAAAERWLEFVTTGKDIRIAEADHSSEFLESAGKATLAAARLIATGTSAALARKLKAPLVTNVEDVKQLADAGFCQVRFF